MRKFSTRSKALSIGALALILALGISAFKADYFEINKQLELFTGVYKEVNLYYVDETEPGKLMENAMVGMLEKLDPYTVFIPESDVEDFRMMQTGAYGGIGSTIRKVDDRVMISNPHQGFPADKAGLRAGDWIKSVDGKSMVGKTTDQVSSVLKGTPGTLVKLTYQRDGVEKTIEIEREEIQLKSVPYYGMINENTGYIYLSSFTDKATKEVKAALEELKKDPNLAHVLLDLRGNPGGLLSEAVNISNLFVDKGTEVVSTKGRLKEVEKSYKTLRSPVDKDIPLAVLINGGSASASEIVAGTIQDLDRGLVVGQLSYGKGLVQQSHPLQYGSQIKITIAKYYTPSGRCIQAINYAERHEDGSVARLPDSLKTEFKTVNGRSVFDGGGVTPDIEVEKEQASGILVSLVNEGHIFDYATWYVNHHQTIAPAGEFALSDAEYAAFVNYLGDKKYSYTTNTEKKIEALKTIAANEEFVDLTDDLNALEKEVATLKANDLQRHKDQIRAYLAEEIAGRYYYQAGQLRQGLKDDPIITAAVNAINNKEKYNEILAIAK